jgi:hypothetical protein
MQGWIVGDHFCEVRTVIPWRYRLGWCSEPAAIEVNLGGVVAVWLCERHARELVGRLEAELVRAAANRK